MQELIVKNILRQFRIGKRYNGYDYIVHAIGLAFFDERFMNCVTKVLYITIAQNYGITLEEWNHDMDHVHIMFRAQPKTELSKFINAYKSASSRLLKKEFPAIRKKLWKEAFWSQSFCLLTTGGAPIEIVRQYIETQGERK